MDPTAPAPSPSTNGNGNAVLPHVSQMEMDRLLTGEPLTQGYRPTLPLWALWSAEVVPQFYLLRDIELMMIHPVVLSALNYYKSGIAGAEFWGGPAPDGNPQGLPVSEDQEVAAFVGEHCQRYWDRGVPLLQAGYEYGWIAGECLYRQEQYLEWDGLLQFSPRDVYLLTQDTRPVGVRVKQVAVEKMEESQQNLERVAGNAPGVVDLWMASEDVPAKGLWYAHNPRYSQFYGQSQLLGAWRPWRRLAWKDAAETVIDGGFYRFGYAGPVIGYPDEVMQAPPGTPNTTLDSQGNAVRYARDMARMMAEWYKSGAGVGMPTTKYPSDMGGGDKWTFKLPESTLDGQGLINYILYLCDQIRYGIGVPPELMQAAETGSGYSGRAIPLEAFMQIQQRLADALLELFVRQVLRPLVRWNFGPQARWQVKVKDLMETRKQKATGGEQMKQRPGRPPVQPETGQGQGREATGPNPYTEGPGVRGGNPANWHPNSHGEGPVVQQPPGSGAMGFSLDADRIRDIARRILAAGRAA
jgi:hypothetical protein